MKLAAIGLLLSFSIALPSHAAPPARTELPEGDGEFLARVAHAFNDITRKAVPSVVSVSTVKTMAMKDSDLPFPVEPRESGPSVRGVGIGSGVIMRPDGTILTNNHVVENAEQVTVALDEKRKVTAHVLGTDPKTDLAVIRIDKHPSSEPLPTISFGDSDGVKVGDWAIAIGSPFGLSRSVSFGIVSSMSRAQMGILDIEDFIQTDAAINPGSSGGPLLNARGEIIGINTAIFSQDGAFNGIGFAIPSRIAREVSEQLIAKGYVSRGWVGLMAQDLDENLGKHFGTKNDKGALISNVVPNGPASTAQIIPGDVVTRFGDSPVETASQLKTLVGKSSIGNEVRVEYLRDGKPKFALLKVTEDPASRKQPHQLAGQAAPKAKGRSSGPLLGIAVEDLPRDIAEALGGKVESGALVVGVRLGSEGYDAGLAPGDIILKTDKENVDSAKDFNRHMRRLKKGNTAVLYIQRGLDERLFLALKQS